MAYDRYDTRDPSRDDRSRWSSDRDWRPEQRGRRDERGFFERAGDEISSWFGDDDAERRRHEDQMRNERDRGFSRQRDPGRPDWFETRGSNERGGFGEGDYNRSWRQELSGPGNRERDWDRERSRDYRPM